MGREKTPWQVKKQMDGQRTTRYKNDSNNKLEKKHIIERSLQKSLEEYTPKIDKVIEDRRNKKQLDLTPKPYCDVSRVMDAVDAGKLLEKDKSL